MTPGPTRSRETRLNDEQNQSRNPGDLRKKNSKHGCLAQYVLHPGKWPAEIQWQRAICKIRRNQARSGESGQKKSKNSLHAHQIEKELVVDRDQLTRHSQFLQKARTMRQVDYQQASKRIEETDHKQSRQKLRAK